MVADMLDYPCVCAAKVVAARVINPIAKTPGIVPLEMLQFQYCTVAVALEKNLLLLRALQH